MASCLCHRSFTVLTTFAIRKSLRVHPTSHSFVLPSGTMVFFEKNAINFLAFKERARRELLSCLDACPGTKALVWDDYLIGPFSLVAEYSVLQEHQVTRMFTLAKSEFPTNLDFTSMVFLVRSELRIIKKLARFIKKAGTMNKGANIPKVYVYFVPAVSTVCQKALIEMCPSAADFVEDFRECPVGAIPLEMDLLSLELESSFRDLYLDEDPAPLHHLATSINAIQQMYGVIPNIYGKGKYSKQLIEMVGKMGKDTANAEWNIASRFDNMFIIDRNVDLITLMSTQLTYEGLVDECFGINQATVRLPADRFPNVGQSSKTNTENDSAKKNEKNEKNEKKDEKKDEKKEKKITLNSTDELYAEIRDKNFSAVGPVFSAKTKFLSAKMGERFSAKEVAEMKEFVAKMPHLLALKQSLTTFMTVAEILKPLVNNDDFLENLEIQQFFLSGGETEKINPKIEELISKNENFEKIIRLIVLQSEINGGLKTNVLQQYKRDIIHSFGFEEIVTLNNLEKAGFFRTSPKKWFRVAKETLKLFVEYGGEGAPRDISYIFSGYAPLSVRLARQLVHPGWRSIQDVLDAMPGERIEAKQKVPDHLRKRRSSIGSSMSGGDESPLVTLVVFVGGVTYSEVSALRFLSNQEESSTIFYVLTTQMINGSTLIESLRETMKPSIL